MMGRVLWRAPQRPRGQAIVIMLWIMTFCTWISMALWQESRDQILWAQRFLVETRLNWSLHAAVLQSLAYAVNAAPGPSAQCPHPWLNARLMSPMPEDVSVSFVIPDDNAFAWRLEPDTAALAVNTITIGQLDFLKEILRLSGFSNARAAEAAQTLVDARDTDPQWVKNPLQNERDVYARELPNGPLERWEDWFFEIKSQDFQTRPFARLRQIVVFWPKEAPFIVDVKASDPIVLRAWIRTKAREFKWPPSQADAVQRLLLRHRRNTWMRDGCLPDRPPKGLGPRLATLLDQIGYFRFVPARFVRFRVRAVDRRSGLGRTAQGVVSLQDWALVSWQVQHTARANDSLSTVEPNLNQGGLK